MPWTVLDCSTSRTPAHEPDESLRSGRSSVVTPARPGPDGLSAEKGTSQMNGLEVLASGLRFGEGPRWHSGKLWFSDMYDHAVKTVDLDGDVQVKVELPGQPSGLGWLPDGTLLMVLMRERQLLRLDHDRLVIHADLGGVATWHCNDMVVDDTGRAYVGNFGFDLHAAEASGDWSAMCAASMAIVEPDGSVAVAATDLRFPNGTVISPDGRTLVVAESMGRCLTAFDRADDGTLSNRRVWADLGDRVPDGICLDAEGCIWVANAGANECFRVAEGGQVLEILETDRRCFACMLGGPDGRHLFVLTSKQSSPTGCLSEREAQVLVTMVATPHAGRP
jgi:sugar lactone lactonase YvrE